jgi:hypothetical protein
VFTKPYHYPILSHTNPLHIFTLYKIHFNIPLEDNRWEDNIRMNLGEKGWEGVDWMHSIPWRALVKVVMNFWV